MNSPARISFLSASGAILVLLSSRADADSTESFSRTTTSGATPLTDTFTIPSFDSSLGTLEAIDLSVEEDTTTDLIVFNTLSSPSGFTTATASVSTTVSGPGSASVVVTDLASLPSGTAAPGLNDFPGVGSTNTNSTSVDPSGFAAWESGQSQTVTLSFVVQDGTFSGVGSPGLFFGGSAVVGGSTTVTYKYVPASTAPVPEPSTWALILGGLVALAYWRVRGVKV